MMNAAAASPVEAACSFCLKPSTEVKRLVAGAGGFLFDGCGAVWARLVQGPAQPAAELAAWEHASTVEEVLESLPRIAAAGDQVEAHLTGWVRRARELGATWARIGESLAMTRQSAWESFLGEEERVRRRGAGRGPQGPPLIPPAPGVTTPGSVERLQGLSLQALH